MKRLPHSAILIAATPAVVLETRLPLWLYAAPDVEQIRDVTYCRQYPEGCS